MECKSIFNTPAEIDPRTQFKKIIHQTGIPTWKNNGNYTKLRVTVLPVKRFLYLFAEPPFRSLGADANRTTSGLIESFGHLLLPMLAWHQYPSVQPNVQLRLIHESNPRSFHERRIDMRMAEKDVE
jgi:hypothetical protein